MAKVDQHWSAGGTGYELQGWSLQKLASDPGTLVEGLFWARTDTHRPMYYDGTSAKKFLLEGDVVGAGGDVTQASASGGAGRLKVSAGADKSITDYSSGAGLVKSDASGVVSPATAGTDYVTADSTNALTNKTFDANGTGNALSNVEVADFAASAINSTTTLSGATNSQFPTAAAVKAYADSLVVGLFDDRGNYDASVGTFPATGGSGAAGAVLKGDIWRISVAGTLGGSAVQVNDTIRALVDSPAQTASNWAIIQGNDEQATTSLLGNTRYATAGETQAKSISDAAVTPAGLSTFVQKFAQTFGDGTTTVFTFTHNLNTLDVIVSVRDASTNEVRHIDPVSATVNSVTLPAYATAPATNSRRVTIIG